jgi:nicotinic acid phosphoribosyltransferase
MKGTTALSNDKYSYTTSFAIFQQGKHTEIGTNEIFYRKPNCKEYPFVILGGTHFALEYLKNLKFQEIDIQILKEILGIKSDSNKKLKGISQ